jgi:hypothetical protein
MSDDDKIRRYKRRDELTMDEEVQVQQAAKRGKPEPRFERPEYTEARREALADAGLEDEGEPTNGKPLEEQSVEDRFQQIRRHQ